jgi:uncharacterized protein (TIGR01244 family)
MNSLKIAENYAVAAQVLPQDIAAIAAEGFKTVICNRPDQEEPGQPTAAEIASACEEAGLIFHHIAVAGMPVADELIQQQKQAIDSSAGPVLAYCRTGGRSQFMWQAIA